MRYLSSLLEVSNNTLGYYDVLGARETGLSCIGVTYGYGTKEELLKAGAIKTADSTRELGKLLGL